MDPRDLIRSATGAGSDDIGESSTQPPTTPLRSLTLDEGVTTRVTTRTTMHERESDDDGSDDHREVPEELLSPKGPDKTEASREMLAALLDTLSVLVKGKRFPAMNSLELLCSVIHGSSSNALKLAERHLGYDGVDPASITREADFLAFRKAITDELASLPVAVTPPSPSELAEAAAIALKHVSVKGALNTNQQRKGLLLTFLNGAPKELQKTFKSQVGWDPERNVFSRPERLAKLRDWLKITANETSSEEEPGAAASKPPAKKPPAKYEKAKLGDEGIEEAHIVKGRSRAEGQSTRDATNLSFMDSDESEAGAEYRPPAAATRSRASERPERERVREKETHSAAARVRNADQGAASRELPGDREIANFAKLFNTLDQLEATAAGEDDLSGPVLTALATVAAVKRQWKKCQKAKSRADWSTLDYDDDCSTVKWSKDLAAEVRVLGSLDPWELTRYWEVSEMLLEESNEQLIPWLRKLMQHVKPVRSSLWTLGSKTDESNSDYHHLLALNKIALWRWCALSPEARRRGERPEEIWREAATTGSLLTFCQPLSGSNKGRLARFQKGEVKGTRPASPTSTTENFWEAAGLIDSEEAFAEMVRDVNRRDRCRNCQQPSHSVAFCKAPRRSDLLCQLCLLGAHREATCPGPPGAPPNMWAALRKLFITRISAPPPKAKEEGEDK